MQLKRPSRGSRSNPSLGLVLCGVAAWFTFAPPTPARDYAVDQSNVWSPPMGTINNIALYAPVGQEFVPGFTSLDIVELLTSDFDWAQDLGAELIVRVRSGSADGEILGTSLPAFVPNQAWEYVTTFEFEAPVPLVPGQLHVIELVHIAGDAWGFTSTNVISGDDPYPYGCTILWGQPQQTMDAWFSEGTTHISPVAPATWGAIKALYRR